MYFGMQSCPQGLCSSYWWTVHGCWLGRIGPVPNLFVNKTPSDLRKEKYAETYQHNTIPAHLCSLWSIYILPSRSNTNHVLLLRWVYCIQRHFGLCLLIMSLPNFKQGTKRFAKPISKWKLKIGMKMPSLSSAFRPESEGIGDSSQGRWFLHLDEPFSNYQLLVYNTAELYSMSYFIFELFLSDDTLNLFQSIRLTAHCVPPRHHSFSADFYFLPFQTSDQKKLFVLNTLKKSSLNPHTVSVTESA